MPKLGKDERLKRLKNHLATLRAGGTISNRDMKSLLCDEQFHEYEEQWQFAKGYKQSIIDGRSELESYTKMLKVADAIWSRYENTSTGYRKAETEYAAQHAYEKALEHLEELIAANPAIEIYLDRAIRFDPGHECSPEAGEVPRYRLSKSHHAIVQPFDSKRDIKLRVTEDALCDLHPEAGESDEID